MDGSDAIVGAASVAAELRERLPGVGDVKVHKLLYYVQGHHLAWHGGTPAFSEPIEAWANGPVVADLWRAEKSSGRAAPSVPLPSAVLEATLFVVSKFGRLTGPDLIRLTHDETPWRSVSERYEPGNWGDQEISHESMADFFAVVDELAPAMREALDVLALGGPEAWSPDPPGALDALAARHLSTTA